MRYSTPLTLKQRLLVQIDLPPVISKLNSIHVDLGSGISPRNPFNANKVIATDFDSVGSTIKHGFEFVGCDLTKRLPFDSESISSCSAFDVLEHIPRWERGSEGITFPFVNLMQEIYRVLQPGGHFLAVTPAFPSPAAFQDPTHVNIITRDTIAYFVNPTSHANELGYGFTGAFNVIYEGWLRGVGPYSTSGLMGQKNFHSLDGLYAWAKLVNRLLKYLTKRKPTHLIWILEKPSQG